MSSKTGKHGHKRDQIKVCVSYGMPKFNTSNALPPRHTKIHILTECTSYDQARHQYYSFTDIKNILSLTPSQNILNFIFF